MLPDADQPLTDPRQPDTVPWSAGETPGVPGGSPLPLTCHTVDRRIGPYRLEKLLGTGAFGEVWLAVREGSLAHTQLAVKLARSSHINLEGMAQEARLWAQAGSHPNVVPIFEAHVYDGLALIAAEYCAEGTLADWLQRHGGKAPSVDVALELLQGLLVGLEHLHRLGIIHRDIKPANILLHKGVPRLADFGMSRCLNTGSQTSLIGGTPAYMAPEAFDGVRSTATDLWSMGVLAYLLLSGELPFPEREWSALFKSVLTRDPKPLPATVPESVQATVWASLEKNPSKRLASAVQMAEFLRQVRGQCTIHDISLTVHVAGFQSTGVMALFINATNLSESLERELTHVWLETDPRIHITNAHRPLPKRLRPQESWETWVELWQLPEAALLNPLAIPVKARLSTGEVVTAVKNEQVPEEGYVPGRHAATTSSQLDPTAASMTRKPPWWKLW